MIGGDTGELEASNALLGQPQALREKLLADGYLYLQQVLDQERILALRQQILQIFRRHGWLVPGTRLELGLTDSVPALEGEAAYFAVYDEIQQLEAFHAFSHSDELAAIMRQAVGVTAFPHPLGIARLGFPNNEECTTPPHQDYPNNQGSIGLTAAWVPLGDCPRSLGGLSILERSAGLGLLPLAFSLGAGARQSKLPEQAADMRWLSADFSCGDVLLFGSLTVHRSLPNRSGNRFRLSVDYRYQQEGEALTPAVLRPHFGRLRWEQIYQGWKSAALHYYWRDKDYREVEWDDSLHQLPDDHLADAVQQSRRYNQRRENLRQGRAKHAPMENSPGLMKKSSDT